MSGKNKAWLDYKEEAGTKWYRTPRGWGFAGEGDNLYLDRVDTGDFDGLPTRRGTGRTRISYYVNYLSVGGYRCGDTQHLYTSDWERVFFHAN